MKQFDSLLYALGQLSDYASHYFESKKQTVLLEVAEHGSSFLSKIISRIIIFIFVIFLMLFGSLTLSIGLSMYFGSMWTGFGIVTGIYLVLIAVIVIFRRPLITNPIINMILKDLYQ